MLLRLGLTLLLATASPASGAPEAPTMPTEPTPAHSEALPVRDTRAVVPPRNLDTHRTFPTFSTLAEWEARRAFIRQRILVSCGLYPLPPKTPLRAKIFGRVEREGYSIEKVYFQTYPGFYLAGNLYRPLRGKREKGKGKSPDSSPLFPLPSSLFPGILVAHGHWGEGRMANGPDGSIAARAITFARQGYVAFTYDMVGYNDTHQIDHKFANDRRHWLWGVSLMGLQTWNSMRALDFLASLPDVDTSRLAITGESGGGTQTMILGAIEDRLAAVAPCVMVSHTMQGGCLCENAPGLRVDISNVEVAAAAAPKYQILVGASGDWTATTMTMEGPSVASVYKLYGQPDRLRYVRFNFGHNINKTSREAVYAFFGNKLLDITSAEKFVEPPYTMEPVASLRVFPDGEPAPKDAKSAEALTQSLILLAQTEVERRKPHDKRSLTQFKKTFQPAWEQTLAVATPTADEILRIEQTPSHWNSASLTQVNFGRAGQGDNIPAVLYTPGGKSASPVVVLVHPEGKAALMDAKTGRPGPLAQALLERGQAVLLLDTFLTGSRADAAASAARRLPFGVFFDTYNRTDIQERVQDLVTACAYLRSRKDIRAISLCGLGKAGLWTLLAAPAADAVAADCAQLDLTGDEALLADDLYAPGLRRLGDFRTTAVLAAPHPLLLQNTGAKFTASGWIDAVYKALGVGPSLRVETKPLADTDLAQWLTLQERTQ